MKHIFWGVLTLIFGNIQLNAQQSCAEAISIIGGEIITVDSILQGEIPIPICASGDDGATAGAWYSYAPEENFTLVIESSFPQNSGIDNRIHVYTGPCEDRVCLGGDDDGGSGFLFELRLNVFAGETYYIAFDDRWDKSGFDFRITEYPFIEPVDPPVLFTSVNIPQITAQYRLGVVDMDGDYLDDIVSVSADKIEILLQQTDGTFILKTFEHDSVRFVPVWSLSAGDLNGDGYKDLIYGDQEGVTFMFSENNGDTFTEVSGEEYVFSQRSNFVDINNDGFLDVFMCHDVAPNVFYINDGEGNLTFNQGGIGDFPNGGNYGSIWVDYDNDGDPDLFIAKCRGGASGAKINELFRNDGDGIFTNVSLESNMADPIQTWSAAWNDYDNDGWMDAIVGASAPTDGMHKLMRNNGDGTFSDTTEGSGWDIFSSLSIEHVSFDFDNDGFTDVWNGRGEIMFNNGDLTFSPAYYDFPGMGSVGDLNDDGFLDIRIGTRIFYNQGNDNNWIKINLQGTESNSNGIGARVEIYGDWGKQIRDVQSGTGFRYMHTINAHFGIGLSETIDSLIVIWPSGIRDLIIQPEINQSLLVVEGDVSVNTSEVVATALNIFPNPVAETLHVHIPESIKIAQFLIINAQGIPVQSVKNNNPYLNVNKLIPGTYWLIAMDKMGNNLVSPFIKN